MKKTTLFIAIIFQIFIAHGQEIKNLHPSYVHVLDFSLRAAEWKLRDALLSQISSGKKDRDKLTSDEEALLEKYDEVYEDIWDILGQGCSWYCGGGAKEVTASSYLKSQGSSNYKAKNAHDLNYKTAWVEGVPGYGIGEFLTYKFSATSPRITEIIVVNGYVKSEAAYRDNSRVKKLKVYLNDKPYAILNLEDKISNQGFKVEPIGYSDRKDRDALETKPDWTLKFEILDVYKGLKYDDVAISEIYFDGLDVHCFAEGTKIQLADNSTENIEHLKIGDLIAYLDLETNQIKPGKIEKLEKVIHHGLVKYKFESGLEIASTQDHPFRIKNKGWASLKPDKSKQYKGFENIEKVNIGDLFLTAKGTDKLISIDFLEGVQETHAISRLSAGDNFIANGLIVGIEELKKENSIPAGAIEGDFDGDGTTEYVWLVPPKFPKKQNEDNFGECEGLCECYLKFSNDKIPSIKLESCIGGTPVNEGDLNNDGADEVGILPAWWTSCWRDYQVYTFRNDKWKYVVAPFSTHCNQWEKGVDAIKKDNSKQGNVIIHYSNLTGDDIVILSKSVLAER